jgi:uncharacterized protein YcfL
MSGSTSILEKIGWSNRNAIDVNINAVLAEPKQLSAICTSEDCCTTRVKGKKRFVASVKKKVKKTVDICPDCGYYLYWNNN